MSLVFNDGFETNDWSLWDTPPAGVGLTITTGAKYAGSYGCNAAPASGDDAQVSVSPVGTTLRFGCRFNLNTAAFSTAAVGPVLEIEGTVAGNIATLNLVRSGASYIIRAIFNPDVAAEIEVDSGALSVGWHTLEVEVVQAATSISADGTGEFWLDSVSQGTTGNYDNFDKFADAEYVHLSNATPDAGTGSGAFFVDDIALRDDATPIFTTFNYSYIQSAGGLAKSALGVSADGAAIFVALEDDVTGAQIVFKATRPASPTVTVVYQPGAGSAANIIATGDPDQMIFFGNFGTDIGVLEHTISTGAESDISPTSIGTDKIQPVAIDPSDIDHIVAVNVTDQDLLESEDGGTTWATLNAALGQTPVAMALIWLGALFPFGGFIAGNDGVDENLEYTPNEFNNIREDTSAALQATGAVTGLDVVTG